MQCLSTNQTTSNIAKNVNKKEKRGRLSSYTKSPDVEFNIDDFEKYAISRLNGIVID